MESNPTAKGLNALYSDILNSIMVEVDDQGRCSNIEIAGGAPVVVGEKRLVLPLPDVLRNSDWDNLIPFHPLSENVIRGESEVIKVLKSGINLKLHVAITTLLSYVLQIASDKNSHNTLSPKQAEILSVLSKADSKTINSFTSILNKTSPVGDNRLISVYLKRGGTLKGENFSRLAVVSFPINEEFDNDNVICGVKLRAKDFEMFKDLWSYVFPNHENLETYSYGSRSLDAPYFDALVGAFIKVTDVLNQKVELFKNLIDDSDYELAYTNTAWKDILGKLSFYNGVIPPLEGNEGVVGVEELSKPQQPAQLQPPAQTQQSTPPWTPQQIVPQAVMASPPQQPEPVPETMSWEEIQRRKSQAQYAPPPPPQYQPQYAQPPQQVMPPPGFAGAPVTVSAQPQPSYYGQQQPPQYAPQPPQYYGQQQPPQYAPQPPQYYGQPQPPQYGRVANTNGGYY